MLLITFHAANAFKLSDFAGVPQELLLLHNDTDADDIEMIESVVSIVANAANAIDEKLEEAKNNKVVNQDEINLKDIEDISDSPEELIDIAEENVSSKVEIGKTPIIEEDQEEKEDEEEEEDKEEGREKEEVIRESATEEELLVDMEKDSIKEEVFLEEESKFLTNLDLNGCPMDGKEVFQMKLYWEKGKYFT